MGKHKELETAICYCFKEEKYIDLALTHTSFNGTKAKTADNNNERLEFLGDSILEHIIALYLFKLLPNEPEGRLTKLKASIVCESSLAKVAAKISLGSCFYMGAGEEKNGGRNRASILADGFEAMLAAVYLDGGFAVAEKVALTLLEENIKEVLTTEADQDYKTALQEKIQQQGANTLRYELSLDEGPPHDRRFGFRVYREEELMGEGFGKSKKEAQQMAAKAGLAYLKELEISVTK